MKLGPVMIDIEGTQLTQEDKELIQHPLVGGLIYFTRNFESREQIQQLTQDIKAVKNIMICVDHEGGRVQRFRKDFTVLPACRKLGNTWDKDKVKAKADAALLGWLMAAELRAINIDFSFAPVLDIDYGNSEVIGDRAFHSDANLITDIAGAYMDGMHEAGMATTGKHYPGHGAVAEDSHLELPVDNRALADIQAQDLIPFIKLNEQKRLDAVMPAHVIYDQIDSQPAGFSSIWIKDMLRKQYQFNGVVFSDDLNMAAAGMAGSFEDRAYAALNAGCDMVLVCNNRPGAIEVIDKVKWQSDTGSEQRLLTMLGKGDKGNWQDLVNSEKWKQATELVAEYKDG